MQSTMQNGSLTINRIFDHSRKIYANSSQVVTLRRAGETPEVQRATFAEVAERAEQLAGALNQIGIQPGDRIGTFCWNTQQHLEAYLAIPSMGAVLHTVNIRLAPEQLAYVINHAGDRTLLVDASLVPLLARLAPSLLTVEHIIIIGDDKDVSSAAEAFTLNAKIKVFSYEEILAAESIGFTWPQVDELAAAAMCYTSGTTGNPKGVVYSHRSTYLHSLAECSGNAFGFTERDRILPIVPMFHANAWGMPYAGWLAGADLIMPNRFMGAEALCPLIAHERVTVSGAVPTVLNDILRYGETNPTDLSSLRMVVCGGSAVSRHLIERFESEHHVRVVQAWGMTETSPLAAIAHPPKNCAGADEMPWRMKTGRVAAGVEVRLMDNEETCAWDGQSTGEIEVRGAWIAGSYYRNADEEKAAHHAADAAKFHDGWLRTGDVGTITADGFIQITDRAKDVIKSGGEWISSVELENELMSHPKIREAAVIGIPDERWTERPLACVVFKSETKASAGELREFLATRVAKWCVPEQWSWLDEIPKTSVGKFDKKSLRAQYAEGTLSIVTDQTVKRSEG